MPGIWKEAVSRPIPKVSPPKAIETDLRPISLTCVISKELETHVVSWLWELLKPLLDPLQFGAIPNCSTVHALVEICNEWFSKTDDSRKRNFIQALLVDYSKAFDRINPNILIQKLIAMDVPPFLSRWIGNFLSDRKQKVKVGNALSEEVDVWGTVPQGTKLGVFLFLMMINDLKTDVPTYKYVDDTTMYQISNNPKDTKLQEAADEIVRWSSMNDMKINAKKTKEMVISFNNIKPDVPHITIQGTQLERVNSVKLLGVHLANDLTWGCHIDYVVGRAQSKMFCLNMLRRSKLSPKDIMGVFCSKIRPILEYAAPVWHGGLTEEQSEALENIQVRACKIALPTMDYESALQQLGLPTLWARREGLCRSLFHKMEDSNDKLHKLLPPAQENVRNTRFHMKYRPPKAQTNRFKDSFIPYALYNFQ